MGGDRSVAVCVIGEYGGLSLSTYLTADGPETIAQKVIADCTFSPESWDDFLIECDPADEQLAIAIEHELQKIKNGHDVVCEEPT